MIIDKVGEGTAEEVAGQLFRRRGLGNTHFPHDRGGGEHRVAALLGEAGLVPEQMLDGDEVIVVVGDVVVIPVQDAEGSEDRGVQDQFPPFLEFHDAHGGKELGNRRHPQQRTGRHRAGTIGTAVPSRVDEGVVLHDGEGNAPEGPCVHEAVHDGVHRRQAGQVVGYAVVETPPLTVEEDGEEEERYEDEAFQWILPARRPKSMMQSAVPSMPRMELSMQRS